MKRQEEIKSLKYFTAVERKETLKETHVEEMTQEYTNALETDPRLSSDIKTGTEIKVI